MQVAELRRTLNLPRDFTSRGEGREEQADENGDDRNDDEKFDQRKYLVMPWRNSS